MTACRWTTLAVLAMSLTACGTRTDLLVDDTGSAEWPGDPVPTPNPPGTYPPPTPGPPPTVTPPNPGPPPTVTPPNPGPPPTVTPPIPGPPPTVTPPPPPTVTPPPPPTVTPPPPPTGTPPPNPDPPDPPPCTGEDAIYLLSTDEGLYTFAPDTLATDWVGAVRCGEELNTMTVGRSGAYVAAYNGNLYRVALDTAACTSTTFDPGQLSGDKYGMGFVADDSPAGETLYITEERDLAVVDRLSKIDTETFELSTVGFFDPTLPPTELTGTSDGRMFGFHIATDSGRARLFEIDPVAVQVRNSVDLPIGLNWRAFDFAFYRGYFYLFIAVDGEVTARVLRVDAETGTVDDIGTVPFPVIGAGVSTCVPAE
jgi:hypothetical protein